MKGGAREGMRGRGTSLFRGLRTLSLKMIVLVGASWDRKCRPLSREILNERRDWMHGYPIASKHTGGAAIVVA
jgi:hypothetical protein